MKLIHICIMAGIIACLSWLTGCASTEYFTAAAPRVIQQLAPGITTRDELVRLAGDPDSVVRLDDGTEVLTWLDTVSRTSGLSAFPLWLIGGSRRTTSATYCLEVHLKDGIVTGHRYLSTQPLDAETAAHAVSGSLAPGPNPASAPQLTFTEGEQP